MSIVHRAISLLRILLVLTFALLVVFQFMSMPGEFAHQASQDPDFGYLRWPMTVVAGVLILCGQVAIVCTWRLLGMVQREQIFSTQAIRWVDVMIGAIGAGCVVLGATSLYLVSIASDPGIPMLLLLLVFGSGVVELLMVVLRGLLAQATALRTDMEAVI